MGQGLFPRGSARMCVGTFMSVCLLARMTHAHRHTHTDTRTRTHTHRHTHTNTHSPTHTHTHTLRNCSQLHGYRCIHLYTHLWVYTSTHIYMHLCMCTSLMGVCVLCVCLCARASQALHDPRPASTQRQRCMPPLLNPRERARARAPSLPSCLPI